MALLAAGAAFEFRPLDLMAGQHRHAAFLAMNPFGTVPVLEIGDQVVAETGAILLSVAELFPEADLLARPGPARMQQMRWLFHVAAIHADFMTWRRSTFRFGDAPDAKAVVQHWMADRLAAAFRATDQAMAGPYLAGDFVCLADLYLFMIAGWWRSRFPFNTGLPRLAAHLAAVGRLSFVRDAYVAERSTFPQFAPSASNVQA